MEESFNGDRYYSLITINEVLVHDKLEIWEEKKTKANEKRFRLQNKPRKKEDFFLPVFCVCLERRVCFDKTVNRDKNNQISKVLIATHTLDRNYTEKRIIFFSISKDFFVLFSSFFFCSLLLAFCYQWNTLVTQINNIK